MRSTSNMRLSQSKLKSVSAKSLHEGGGCILDWSSGSERDCALLMPLVTYVEVLSSATLDIHGEDDVRSPVALGTMKFVFGLIGRFWSPEVELSISHVSRAALHERKFAMLFLRRPSYVSTFPWYQVA